MSGTFHQQLTRLQEQRHLALKQTTPKKIVILGAGPAGLIRAIQSLIQGDNVIVIEKRAGNSLGRNNVVSLIEKTITLLKELAVYHYLLEKKLIRQVKKPVSIFLRLTDLEQALKVVIHSLSPGIIHYDSKVGDLISNQDEKATVVINKNSKTEWNITSIDVLIIAEGANTSTNQLCLNNKIEELLPPVEGLLAFFNKLPFSWESIVKKIKNVSLLLCSHFIFLFNFTFRGLHFWNKKRKIAFSVLTKTPGQYYLAGAFAKTEEDHLKYLLNQIEKSKSQLSAANLDPNGIKELKKSINKQEKQLNTYLTYWTYQFLWYANYFKLVSFILRKELSFLNFGTFYPLTHITLVTNVVQRSKTPAGLIGKTLYLVVGDALTTADTLTGMGCNVSIWTSIYSARLLNQITSTLNFNQLTDLVNDYNKKLNYEIHNLYYESINMRLAYRPDSLI